MYTMLATIQGWCPWCGDHMGWGGWGMMFGWTFILVLVVLAVWAIGQGKWPGGGSGDRGAGAGEDRAEAVLREQYARGEIDEETYRRRLNELRRE
jgi:putative membrane protein